MLSSRQRASATVSRRCVVVRLVVLLRGGYQVVGPGPRLELVRDESGWTKYPQGMAKRTDASRNEVGVGVDRSPMLDCSRCGSREEEVTSTRLPANAKVQH